MRDRLTDYINSEPELEEIFRYCTSRKESFLIVALKYLKRHDWHSNIRSFYNRNDNPKFHNKINYLYNVTRYIHLETVSFWGH